MDTGDTRTVRERTNLYQSSDGFWYDLEGNVYCQDNEGRYVSEMPAPDCYYRDEPQLSAASNAVNGPQHYRFANGMQAIDIIGLVFDKDEFVGAMIYNCFKYLLRFKRKNGVEDLEKAKVYLSWAIEKLTKGTVTHE